MLMQTVDFSNGLSEEGIMPSMQAICMPSLAQVSSSVIGGYYGTQYRIFPQSFSVYFFIKNITLLSSTTQKR